MLFNSLNTLRSLIRETPGKAQEYLQELSRVLRYTLQENECRSVTLREEMDFVNAYIFLLKMRYEDNLVFDIDLGKEHESKQLPPMSVQLLIENAVKHNEISNRHSLTISVRSDHDSLTVSNPIQPKLTHSGGTGIGLVNLSKRYNLCRIDIILGFCVRNHSGIDLHDTDIDFFRPIVFQKRTAPLTYYASMRLFFLFVFN